ncbi:MAG TPA: hypothetical protein VJ823_01710 [Rhodanobacteraceae bacterium]|nr:hypothetical protein [Rhodanobacteraceae bacterium]
MPYIDPADREAVAREFIALHADFPPPTDHVAMAALAILSRRSIRR